jgi:L-lactate dehydrogenase complex protein LldG
LLTRQQMLQKIRIALGRGETNAAGSRSELAALPDLGPVLPVISPSDFVATFEDELRKVGGYTYRAENRSQIAEVFGRVLKIDGTERPTPLQGLVLSRNPLLARLGIKEIVEGLGISAWPWPGAAGSGLAPEDERAYRERCFSAGAGVTGVDFALAESGSLVLTSRTEGSQLSSLAPPIHIAFYLRSQALGSLEEVLSGLAARGLSPSDSSGRSVVFVTGTSRTADIEQILIRGVHGPREVHAVLIEGMAD